MGLNKKPYRYIQFPIHLLGEMLNKPQQALEKILCYGIVWYAKRIKLSVDKVATQLYYDYCQDLQKLTGRVLDNKLFQMLENNIDVDESYYGFRNGEFSIESDEMDLILNILDKDAELKSIAIKHMENHNVKQSMKFYGYTGDVDYVIKIADNINYKDEIHTSTSIKILTNYLNQEKSEFENLQFMAYAGLKSILGKKRYWKTNKNHIRARMFGYGTHKCLLANNFDKSPIHIKYSNRYHIDKLLNILELNWGFVFNGYHVKGIYFGTKRKISFEELDKIINEKKTQNRIKAMKDSKKEIRKKNRKK